MKAANEREAFASLKVRRIASRMCRLSCGFGVAVAC